MRYLWWLGTCCMAVIRLYLLGVLVQRGDIVSLSYCAIETLSLLFGLANLRAARWRDYSAGGLWVSFCYAVGVWLLPAPVYGGLPGFEVWFLPTDILSSFMSAFAFCLSAWALFCLKFRFTFGGSAWVSLCNSGPYAYIRHPQLTARMLIIMAVNLTAISYLGWLRCILCLALTYSVVLVEERGLRTLPEYNEYISYVPERFIPGLF